MTTKEIRELQHMVSIKKEEDVVLVYWTNPEYDTHSAIYHAEEMDQAIRLYDEVKKRGAVPAFVMHKGKFIKKQLTNKGAQERFGDHEK